MIDWKGSPQNSTLFETVSATCSEARFPFKEMAATLALF